MSFPDRSAASRVTTDERGGGKSNQLQFTPEPSNRQSSSSARFGALSHHSFFSRHNPHPHRVRHIQGLNGRLICMVRDDWNVTTSLFPHPLLKSHILRETTRQPFSFPLAPTLCGLGNNKSQTTAFSEAWRDALKELAAKVHLSAQEQKDKKEDQPEGLFGRRKTQYSAQTGRLIPPSSKSSQRVSRSQQHIYPQPLHDQELMVLELLCQILQTDSLTTVQQWLLLAGQREKDQVMGMVREALAGVGQHQQIQAYHPSLSAPALCGSSLTQPWRKPPQTRVNRSLSDVKPERIGDAEVLQIPAKSENCPPDQEHPDTV
ncbi:protein TBATA [Takifugu rubripes]|uniref:protein TBATA n=1 Tax=Takifugu rubripes TaxID=31033 RepID=UPI001145F502|nr:protein TBATA [Takifugu rubripes]